ncbi:MAG: DUF3857 domain-containing transglutaminase family protein [bacterium]|jgi:hypothetical protein
MNRAAVRIIPYVAALVVLTALPGAAPSVAGEGAVYEYLRWKYFIGDGKYTERLEFRVTIQNASGIDFGNLYTYEDKFSQIKKFQARLLDASGKVRETVARKDLTRARGFGADYQTYSDICRYFREIGSPQYPYTVECEVEREVSSLFFWNGQLFQEKVPVRQFQLIIDCPKDFKFRHKIKGFSAEPTISENKERLTYSWELSDIPAWQDVRYAPPGLPVRGKFILQAESVVFGGVPLPEFSWKGVGQWFRALSRGCYLATAIDSAVSPISQDSFRLAIMNQYNNLTERMRYVSVSIGLSGWKPNAASLVEQRGYGDCKDLSVLLISRLRAAGIAAFPALVLTSDEGLLETDFPNFGFNHVIVAAVRNDDTVWMDPTCFHCPLGELPSGVEDVAALIVTDSGGILTRTPSSRAEDNIIRRNTMLVISDTGLVRFDSQIDFYGNLALYYRNRLDGSDRDELQNILNGLFPGGEKSVRVTSHEIQNQKEREKPLIFKVSGVRLRSLNRIGSIYFLQPDIFNTLGLVEEINLDKRITTISLGYSWTVEDSVGVTWESSFAFDSLALPPDCKVNSDFCDASTRHLKAENGLNSIIRQEVRSCQVSPEQFPTLRDYRKQVSDCLSKQVKFIRR